MVLEHKDLLDPRIRTQDLERIRRAYGTDGMGVALVRGIPGVREKRNRLLRMASEIASLPSTKLLELEDPLSRYNFGWSHGKETLEGGRPDRMKGSYYNNPLYNVPTEDPEVLESFPSSARPNVWPKQDLPELEAAFMDLGALVVQVGILVAKHCDKYVEREIGGQLSESRSMEHVIRRSRCPKARLLHYFPPEKASGTDPEGETKWCGWHTDHGTLTGLVSAMYLHGDREVPCPEPGCGLYVRDRAGEVVQITFGEDEIAYQMGEASQILSGGFLHATPHYVRAPSTEQAEGISRNTFAVFMQPQWDVSMDPPPGYEEEARKNVPAWDVGLNFGQFSERTFRMYYG